MAVSSAVSSQKRVAALRIWKSSFENCETRFAGRGSDRTGKLEKGLRGFESCASIADFLKVFNLVWNVCVLMYVSMGTRPRFKNDRTIN